MTAIDLALISTGVVTSGVILHKAQNGSIELNPNISLSLKRNNPELENQRKRDRDSRQETEKIKMQHAEDVKQNIGEPTPDGGNDPRGAGNNKLVDIVVGTGLFGAAVKAISDIVKPADSNSTSVDADNQKSNTTITQGVNKSSSTQNSSFINPIWNPPTIEKEKYSNVKIPLKLDDEK